MQDTLYFANDHSRGTVYSYTPISAMPPYSVLFLFKGHQVLQSAHFCEAESLAGVPFLDHHLLECDSTGREWTNVDHDITVRIPEGAVAEGEKIHFEVGVAMYGPFTFPDNTQPISPILWLCLLEENVDLKKPFQVVLPHYLTGLTIESIQNHNICFAKASHQIKSSVHEDGQIHYIFHKSETDSKPPLALSGGKSFGVLESKHCCFYCLLAKQSHELATEAGYCLVRMESLLSPKRNEISFAVVYFLNTCIKVNYIIILL